MFTLLQAKSVSDEFVYDEYRQRKIREKIDEKVASRVKTKVSFIMCPFSRATACAERAICYRPSICYQFYRSKDPTNTIL